ncbi:MAG: class I SAM-dependent RNA methyltransferase, partial [Clostridia bacterium]|nr:class I SAM-dependent RNA methyltransferase [Clostridia bacterium]
MRFIATCKLGLEALVASELRRLQIETESVADARVTFLGDFSTMAKACLWLRTAERVLFEVGAFEATTFDQLFEGVKAIPWKRYLKRDSFIHVNGKSAKSTLFSVSDCQKIIKKAIVERLKSVYGIQWFDETGPLYQVQFSIMKDRASLC